MTRQPVGMSGPIAVLALLAGCMMEPAPPAAPIPPPDTAVLFYPAQGQTLERQDRDKYECNGWAVKQSGFDPSLPSTPPHLRVRAVIEPPPGTGVAVGAVSGAVLGAAVSRPWESGSGALAGAVAGALIGGIADSARLEQARAAASSDTTGGRAALLEQMAGNYRRAMAACLEGRGYSVR
jgi:hypothetical protein